MDTIGIDKKVIGTDFCTFRVHVFNSALYIKMLCSEEIVSHYNFTVRLYCNELLYSSIL